MNNPKINSHHNMDRYEHVDAYVTHISLYTTYGALLFWVFSTSLKRATLRWFTRLWAHSIHCFHTLVTKFETQFTTSRPHHLTSIGLVYIRQEKMESLHTFMEQYDKVTLSIQNLSSEVAMHHMVTILKPSLFLDSLYKKLAMDRNELH